MGIFYPAVRQIASEGLSLMSPVTFLIGENGSGKSTIIEAVAVACGFNPEGGTRNFGIFNIRHALESSFRYENYAQSIS